MREPRQFDIGLLEDLEDLVCSGEMLFQRIGQPRVMGEVTAGILLGPTLLGKVAPDVQQSLFPSDVIPFIGGGTVAGPNYFIAGLIHHADRGSQYCSIEYQAELRKHGIRISMSGTGNCFDCENVRAARGA